VYNKKYTKEEVMYMFANDKIICSNCGTCTKYYDKVPRIVRGKNRSTKSIQVKRFKCPTCGSIHRSLPNYIFPYKQYEADIITGVIEELITSNTIGFEDYPCEMTMLRWKTQNLHAPL
jgi:heterodisulfide reductase subunit A-like polyferredoxin